MAQHSELQYDIIIVGGGTSGCVLANRLSEDPTVLILLLEAGREHSDDPRIYTPGLTGSVFDDPEFDWQYVAEPAPAMNGRSIKHPRGRVIGGTSAINSFALIYPSAAGIDAWAGLGNNGWDWSTLGPYFLKFQTIVPPQKEVKEQVHIVHSDENIAKSRGPIQASFPLRVNKLQKAWVDTFRTLDLEATCDPIDGHAVGGHTSTCHITGDRHERSHAGVAYLDPVRERSNLTVITNAMVNKLLFDKTSTGPRVRGVLYSKDGALHEVMARKEVVLAAGTFNTPQILELSGIGDPKLLKQHGINLVHANSAVGENLQDHIRPGVSFELVDGFPPPLTATPVEEARRLYEEERSGPWAEQAAFAFSYTPLVPFLDPEGNTELQHLLNDHLQDDSGVSPFIRDRNAFIRKVIESPDEASTVTFLSRKRVYEADQGNFLTLFSMLSHPLSAGNARIVSADPITKPKIDFDYYGHPLDLEIHARHIQALDKIARTEPLASCLKPGGRRLPEEFPLETIESAKGLARAHAVTNYHPCGTCSLGTVVDSRLNVKGVLGLRVVDASIMPIIPRGNIIATIYAVAERAADIISEDLSIRRST